MYMTLRQKHEYKHELQQKTNINRRTTPFSAQNTNINRSDKKTNINRRTTPVSAQTVSWSFWFLTNSIKSVCASIASIDMEQSSVEYLLHAPLQNLYYMYLRRSNKRHIRTQKSDM